ncbi:MAG: tricarballylate utilization 4Fe-4S protein TcuB [Propionibacteriaceae bacterium]|nr:tricarballylate utilization 4Fe-4S protein TcuB [Propionibacteriaceae bacterium]
MIAHSVTTKRGGQDGFRDAKRQLDICNSCRYCAGYCPVWPALERRTDLTPGDVTHLANLCHDCRDCYLACMYTPPHEFGVNPPQTFAEERTATYHRFIWPAARIRQSAVLATVIAVVAMAVILVGLALLVTRGNALGTSDGSPYSVIQHGLLIVLVGAPAVYAVVVILAAILRYWRFTSGSVRELFHGQAWMSAIGQAVTLKHQSGGAEQGCTYPDDRPRQQRRVFHEFVMLGFLLTFFSTASAAFSQYVMSALPPYPVVSVPVITGTIGGIGQVVGCAGLLLLKRRSERGQTTPVMWRADFSFLWALVVLNLTGLLVLFVRDTPVFPWLLIVHLACVIVTFSVAPYTKFVHFVFRVLAIYQNVLETRAPVSPA